MVPTIEVNIEDSMNTEPLDEFGRGLIQHVRDSTIEQVCGILCGKMNSGEAQRLREQTHGIDTAALDAVVIASVDRALHNLLWWQEQEETLAVPTTTGTQPLAELSDGLAGELYDIDGWIARFSEIPSTY